MTAAPAPVGHLAGGHISTTISGETQAEQYARQIAGETGTDKERPLTEAEIAREMARADAKQFADILRNWIK
jgi:flagellar biosynthesis/type III secretory pathway M-ring protein FliF/YscJ